MKDYITLIKELRETMNSSKPTRYWGTLILLILGAAFIVAVFKAPEIIEALK